MCILFWALDSHPKYQFIFAANRDEYLDRLTTRANFWPAPHDRVLAGRDLQHSGNGTWLGINRSGRFAALTNYREPPEDLPPDLISRGYLVRDYIVEGDVGSPRKYLERVEKRSDRFGGFSLLCADLGREAGEAERGEGRMAYYANRDNVKVMELEPGKIYGLSNSVLEAPWPKVEEGRKVMARILENAPEGEALIEDLFTLLGTHIPFTDVTNITQSIEETKTRIRVPIFNLNSQPYSTRTSTIILVDRRGTVTFVERDWFDTEAMRELEEEERRTLGEVRWSFTIGEEGLKMVQKTVEVKGAEKGEGEVA